jgi:hypothetical protein
LSGRIDGDDPGSGDTTGAIEGGAADTADLSPRWKAWLPNFLGVGVPKAGTTWLTSNLRRHPDIWLPPRKELHYFTRSLSYPSASLLATAGVVHRLFGPEPHNRRWRKRALEHLKRLCTQRNRRRASWELRYFFGHYGDAWYASLFRGGRHKTSGEFTPAYCILDQPDIERIVSLIPGVKVIFLLRNPVDRAWSTIKKTARRNGYPNASAAPPEEWERFLGGRRQCLRADYARAIGNWRRCLPHDRVFIGFFEDLVGDPAALLLRAYGFLGVDASPHHVPDQVHRRRNVSPEEPMPEELRLYAAVVMHESMRRSAEMLGGHALQWLDEAERTIRGATNHRLETVRRQIADEVRT